MAAVYEAEYRRRDAAPVAGGMAVSLLDIARLAYTASSPDDLFDRLVSTRVSDVARRVPSRWGRISLGEFVAMVEEGGERPTTRATWQRMRTSWSCSGPSSSRSRLQTLPSGLRG
jgi:hypothetical protein